MGVVVGSIRQSQSFLQVLLKFVVMLCEVSTRTSKDRDRLGNLSLPQR
jgi:hypothetical protein